MHRIFIVGLVSILVASSCYDLSFKDDSHTVTEFQILAVRVEPPELRPDTPLTADVLYADPQGGEAPIHAAWSVRLYDRNAAAERQGGVTVAPEDSGETGIQVSAPQFRLAEKYSDPVLLFEVYLCHGGLKDAARVGVAATSVLLDSLCTEGKSAAGVKYISPVSAFAAQNNPRIARVTINGAAVTALEDGGKPLVLCGNGVGCESPVVLQAYLDIDSVDMIPLEAMGLSAEENEMDAGDLADGGAADEYPEYHRVDWFVTGGTLTSGSSFMPNNAEDALNQGFRTTWSLPNAASAPLTLFVIARDIRGGNDWRTFQAVVGGN